MLLLRGVGSVKHSTLVLEAAATMVVFLPEVL